MEVTQSQIEQYQTDGYFVAKGVLDAQDIAKIRATVEAMLAAPENVPGAFLDPELEVRHGGGKDWQARDRYRKIGQPGLHSADFWNDWHLQSNVLDIVRFFLGDNIRLMYSSVFLKPARVGAATPWHQDIGLWGHKTEGALSIWAALDSATRENGCLQFIPGSHQFGEVEHSLYEGGIHKEIRRDLLQGLTPVYVELEPGDAVIWHASIFHHSPPNLSSQNRIGVAGVYVNQQMAEEMGEAPRLPLPWVMKKGALCRKCDA